MEHQSPTFTPPHCPNHNCPFHSGMASSWRFKRMGYFRRHSAPQRIPRFLCLECRRSFSSQTFSTTYWLRKPEVLAALLPRTVGCMANRQLARSIGVAPSTVDRQLARLGRHCLLYHGSVLGSGTPASTVVIDGFVSFEHSQYRPFHHHVAIEPRSDFIVYFTDSEVRRSGAMTKAQRRRRTEIEARHGRPAPRAVEDDVHHLLAVAAAGHNQMTVLSDDHRAYPRAIRSLPIPATHLITSAKQRRDAANPLFPVNLFDMLVRHCSANHKRETIAWSKRRQASAERLAIFTVWRNYMNPHREKQRHGPTPAMILGVAGERLEVALLLRRRLFPHRVGLPARWWDYYRRRIMTRGMADQTVHVRKYAF